MGCNCKTVNNGDDVDNIVSNSVKMKKLSFFDKLKIIYAFSEFYFFFVTTSIINFIVNDNLTPRIPKRLIKKYNRF